MERLASTDRISTNEFNIFVADHFFACAGVLERKQRAKARARAYRRCANYLCENPVSILPFAVSKDFDALTNLPTIGAFLAKKIVTLAEVFVKREGLEGGEDNAVRARHSGQTDSPHEVVRRESTVYSRRLRFQEFLQEIDRVVKPDSESLRA